MISAKNSYLLPNSWALTTLGTITDISSGYGFPKDYQGKTEGQIPFFKVMDISKAVLRRSIYLRKADNYISFDECEEIKAKPLKKGTIVFAKIGEAIKLDRRAILAQDSLLDNNIMGILRLSEEVNNLFLFYFLNTIKLGDYSRATTVPSLRKSDVELIHFPLPPFPEQGRIIAKIEELFSRLNTGVEALQKAKAQLKRYRQAVLKAAVEGRLTEEWRKAHLEVESTEKLLALISKERRCFLEHNLHAKTSAKGERQKKIKYKESEMPKSIDLPKLPKGWAWATIDQLSAYEHNSITDGPFGSNLKTSHYTSNGPRVIRLQNIGKGEFIDEEAHISEDHFNKLKKHMVYPGDIVIAALGNPAPRACLIPKWVGDAIVKADCIRLKVVEGKISAPYVMYSLNSIPTQKRTEDVVHGVGRPRLNLGEIKNIIVPLPPLEEQKIVAEEIERRLSIADKIKDAIEADVKRSEFLRQSILKRAFEGKLVPQDPNDEPASMLLERIKAERARKTSGLKNRSKSGKTKDVKQSVLS